MRLYVSGPMSGMENYNFHVFNSAADRLRQHGYSVSNPAEHGFIEGFSWEDYLSADLKHMLDCDGIATLPGWQRSAGAVLEVETATKLGKAVAPVGFWIGVSHAPATMWAKGEEE